MRAKTSPPLIFNLYKPARLGSLDLVRSFKKKFLLDPHRIGHFGTLDPFASGVMLVAVGGAARLNEFIHEELPKTYLAIGKLGVQTDTADWQGKIKQVDDTAYSKKVISSFDLKFLKERLEEKFTGSYWQTPPIYSATKFEGKALHEWARAGVEIKKEPVERFIHQIEILKYAYPYVGFRVRAGSGTYIRTLFEDMCFELGTIGHLIGLVREGIGDIHMRDSLRPKFFNSEFMSLGLKPEEVIRYPRLELPEERKKAFLNGLSSRLSQSVDSSRAWVMSEGENWGLVEKKNDEWKTLINFQALKLAQSNLP